MNKFAEAMVELGTNSTFDPTKLSKATLLSSASHIKTLQRNMISLDEESLTYDTVNVLDKLKDANGKPLDDMYKRQIGMTIKRMFPNRRINLDKYNKARAKTRKANTRLASEDFVETQRKIIERASLVIKDVYTLNEIEDLGLYDACLAILLTISTSLRINELKQLKLSHIPRIRANEPVDIVSKSSRNARIVTPNNMLLSIFDAIHAQRSKVQQNITIKKLDYASKLQTQRFNDGYILINSVDYMRKKLKELSASLSIKSQTLGFNLFRKYITTMLVEGGAHLVAQSMNNHSSLNTTLNHYNVIAPQTVQNTYNDLIGTFDDLIRVPSKNSIDYIRTQLEHEVLLEKSKSQQTNENVASSSDNSTRSNEILIKTVEGLSSKLYEKNQQLQQLQKQQQQQQTNQIATTSAATRLYDNINPGNAALGSLLTPENTQM